MKTDEKYIPILWVFWLSVGERKSTTTINPNAGPTPLFRTLDHAGSASLNVAQHATRPTSAGANEDGQPPDNEPSNGQQSDEPPDGKYPDEPPDGE